MFVKGSQVAIFPSNNLSSCLAPVNQGYFSKVVTKTKFLLILHINLFFSYSNRAFSLSNNIEISSVFKLIDDHFIRLYQTSFHPLHEQLNQYISQTVAEELEVLVFFKLVSISKLLHIFSSLLLSHFFEEREKTFVLLNDLCKDLMATLLLIEGLRLSKNDFS